MAILFPTLELCLPELEADCLAILHDSRGTFRGFLGSIPLPAAELLRQPCHLYQHGDSIPIKLYFPSPLSQRVLFAKVPCTKHMLAISNPHFRATVRYVRSGGKVQGEFEHDN